MRRVPNPPPAADRFIKDRALGALLGAAVGDALGATLEFAPYDPLRLHTEMLGGGPFGVRPGEWSDDTAMALALADALLDYGGFTPRGFMTRLARWRGHGDFSCQGLCVDIGRSTAAAIERFIASGEALCTEESHSGAGNGSLVRLAPVALHHLHDADEAERIARLQSTCTHPARAAAEACAFVVTVLRELILDIPNASLPRRLHAEANKEITAIAHGRYLTLRHLNPTGYVADTLETALWALHHTETFEQALTSAVSLGGDSDSIGAVAGMLAGATYGLIAIPERWLRRLAWREHIIATGEKLLESAARTVG